MKKISIVFLILLATIILSSCDYPEKSFQALFRDDIPKVVTRDFKLQKGVYAPFIWTTDNKAITIDGLTAVVNQENEDMLVILTATINKKSESFEILVLKEGSELSDREKGEDAALILHKMEFIIDDNIYALPNEIDSVYIKYYLSSNDLIISHYQEDFITYISNSFMISFGSFSVRVGFYLNADFTGEAVYSTNLKIKTLKMDTNDPFMLALREINFNNYSFDGSRLIISKLELGSVIEFSDSTDILYSLSHNEERLETISHNKVKVVKEFRTPRTPESLILTINIGKLEKRINVLLYSGSN